MTDMTTEIDEALAGWLDGFEVIAQRDLPQHNERYVVAKEIGMQSDNYSLFRAFPLGNYIAVSGDLQNVTLSEVVVHLMAGIK